MLTTRFIVSTLIIGLMILGVSTVSAQNYPNKPIRMVTLEAGGGGDFTTRLIVPGLSNIFDQPVIVDNRAAALIPEIVAKSPPDGYVLLSYGNPIWILPLLQHTSYNPESDFSPITLVVSTPNILVIHPSLPVRSVKELIALAKAKPGALNYAAAASGSGPHLAGELFKAMAEINIVSIPYKGGGPAITNLIGGEVQIMFTNAASIMSHVKSGRLRALAVTSLYPSAQFPGLPTVAASGLPGYQSESWQGIWAPAKTPEIIIKRLNQEIVRVLNQLDVKQKFIDAGYEIVGNSPDEAAARIKAEIVKWGKVIKDANIRIE